MEKAKNHQNTSTFIRQCDDLGRIALPEALLRHMGVSDRASLAIRQTGPRSIRISLPDGPRCLICGDGESLFQVLGNYICAGCLIRINEDFILGREPDISGLEEED